MEAYLFEVGVESLLELVEGDLVKIHVSDLVGFESLLSEVSLTLLLAAFVHHGQRYLLLLLKILPNREVRHVCQWERS